MSPEMKRLLKWLYLAIEVNLVLWLAALGIEIGSDENHKLIIIVGFLFAAVFQHWAYYAVYKRAKEGRN